MQTIDALVVAQKQLLSNPFTKIRTLGEPGLANTRCNTQRIIVTQIEKDIDPSLPVSHTSL